MKRAFLTPPSIPSAKRCRTIRVPDSIEWLALVGGALAPLLIDTNWEPFGAVTPAEAATEAEAILESYYEDACMEIGVVCPFCSADVPAGWLPMQGNFYLVADYPALAAVLDPVLIQPDPDHFYLPNLGGKVIVGNYDEAGMFASGGAATHTLTVSEMPGHSHGISPHAHSEVIAVPTPILIGAGAPAPSAIPGAGVTGLTGLTTDSQGGGAAHNNMPPYVILRYCIRAQ